MTADVGILAPTGLADWARIGFLRVLTRSPRDYRCLERFRARQVEITADADLPRQTDGEIIAPGRSLIATIRPGVLTIRTPARDRLAMNSGPMPGQGPEPGTLTGVATPGLPRRYAAGGRN